MLGKGRVDRAEALVEPGHVELRGHGGGGGWRYYVSGLVDLLRHASGWKNEVRPGLASEHASKCEFFGSFLKKSSDCEPISHFTSVQSLATIIMERSIEVQAQIRRDAEDHCRALRELKEWEEEMKRRQEEEEEQLQRQKDTTTNFSGVENGTAKVAEQIDNQPPGLTTQPVRTGNVAANGHNGGVGGVRTNANSTASTMSTPTLISNHQSSAKPSSEEEMTANAERQRGNDCYAAGKYDDAIKCYTACLRFDPRSAVVYSNRGMCRLTYIQFLLFLQSSSPVYI